MMLDLSDVFDDDLLSRGILVRRRAQDIGANGRATNYEQDYLMDAIVTNDAPDEIERRPEGSRASKSITVHTQFALIAADRGTDADVIVWQGESYMVKNLTDYLHLGGFVTATAYRVPYEGD